MPIAAVGPSEELELVLLALVAGTTILLLIADRVRMPYPILLMIGGLVLGVMPGAPEVTMPPELVLLVFLPPLLYAAAFFSSYRELRANARPISLLAVGLVLLTAVTVALPAHYVIGLDWAQAFVLGAVVSPTDPIAATAIASRLGAPRRIVVVVEGEALVNDATALVAYSFAVVAVTAGTFSAVDAGFEFVVGIIGGAAIGFAVAWVVQHLRRRTSDTQIAIAISVATAYLAYIPAELAGVSGVVAAVVCGVYLGYHSPELMEPTTRLRGAAFWETLLFLVNVILFVLIGLQLPVVAEGLEGQPVLELVAWAALICAVVMLTRVAWVFFATWAPRAMSERIRTRDPMPSMQMRLLLGWIGMRGGVTLAAALAIPLETDAGAPFADRELIVFLSFAVVVVTLLLQGLTLPATIRRLGLAGNDGSDWREHEARLRAAEAALARIDELAGEDWAREDTLERMRGLYDYRRRRFSARIGYDEGTDGYEQRSLAFMRVRRELLEAERAAVVDLRNRGVINDEVLRRVQRDLDLEAERLEA